MICSKADYNGAKSVDLLPQHVCLQRARYLLVTLYPFGDTHQSPIWIKALEGS
jgi:hypothetical protein